MTTVGTDIPAQFKKDTDRIWRENCTKMTLTLMERKGKVYDLFLKNTLDELTRNEDVGQLEFCWRLTDLFCKKMKVDECYPVVLTDDRIEVLSTLHLPMVFSESLILLGFCTYVEEPRIKIVDVMPLPCWEELSSLVGTSMRVARIATVPDILSEEKQNIFWPSEKCNPGKRQK